MLKRARKIRFVGKARIWAIALVALFEAALLGVVWNHSQSKAEVAYLMKVGARYILAWKDTEARYDTVVYSSLDEALRYAEEELGMRRGRNVLESGDVEYLSFNDRPAGYVVQWKIQKVPFVNQLTFHSQSEARYFWDSIRVGSYAPSPFGHSLLFLPKAD